LSDIRLVSKGVFCFYCLLKQSKTEDTC